MKIKLRLLTVLLTEILQPLIARIDSMNAKIDEAAVAQSAVHQALSQTLSLNAQLIQRATDLKQKLTDALVGALSTEDQAKVQAIIDQDNADVAQLQTAAQSIADTLSQTAPSN